MKGTFAERPKKVKKPVAPAEDSADTKRQKKKAAKEQARIQQQTPAAQNMLAPGYGNMMAGGKDLFIYSVVLDVQLAWLDFMVMLCLLGMMAAVPDQPPNQILFLTNLPDETNEMMLSMLFNQ